MKQPSFFLPAPRRSGGAGLVTAIFLLVVLAGLATALVSVFTAQRQSSTLDEMGVRAYQAARAGIEWSLFQRATKSPQCAGSFALPADSVLAGFAVTVTCTAAAGPETNTGADLTRWIIRATACTTSGTTCVNAARGADYVERVLEVEL